VTWYCPMETAIASISKGREEKRAKRTTLRIYRSLPAQMKEERRKGKRSQEIITLKRQRPSIRKLIGAQRKKEGK